MILYHITDTYCGDHTVEDYRDAADRRSGHSRDQSSKLRAEGEDYSINRSQTNDFRIINFGQHQHARVFTVGRIGRCSEERRDRCADTVTDEGAVQARILDQILFDSSADGGYVTDMLHHRCESYRDYHNDRGDEKTGIDIA